MTLDTIDRCVTVILGALCMTAMVFGMDMRGDAGLFPIAAGALGLLACIGVLVSTLRDRAPDELPEPLPWARLLLWSLCVLSLLVLLVTAGALITLPLFLLVTLRWLAHLKWRWALLIALVFSAAIYLVFVHLLSVPLPAGLLAG
ncbi:tripartite tricarboxylate transporter TctB family protein [Halomonas sp. HNIBRBA4712]|uniref:tripartite tricarboxylate transporter TctB family protein n=1 Tax=Halomonas sp. HNIBRBA4712 TaxID=3373087 RepID=UPI0037452916